MDPRTELAEFLRSRRARLRPADVGLRTNGMRRVPGLRREELAQLAGVSVAYYTRLEQGRRHHVSQPVLDGLAEALRLNGAERAHLTRLLRPDVREPRRDQPLRPQVVRPELQQLLDELDTVPAYVIGRRSDLLAWNAMATALFGDFAEVPRSERNLTRIVFLDPSARELYDDWEEKAATMVAGLRAEASRRPDDRALAALIGELSVASQDFARLWAAHDIRDKGPGTKRLHHPDAGALTLHCETLVLPADPDQLLVTYHAEPGSPAREALLALAPPPR